MTSEVLNENQFHFALGRSLNAKLMFHLPHLSTALLVFMFMYDNRMYTDISVLARALAVRIKELEDEANGTKVQNARR